jgi:endonuclease-3
VRRLSACRAGGRCSEISKQPFDIDEVMRRVELAVQPYPKAALFELAEEGFDSPFEQLVACIISIRTRDEVTLPTARRLFERARTPQALSRLAPQTIDAVIVDSAFHARKADQIHLLAQRLMEEFGGELPCERETLLSFKGVGIKCANLTLSIACGRPSISVDVHVHRITNRWGYVQTDSPESTTRALEEALPRRYWVDINRLLVPFGKHICTGRRPRCSECPLSGMCRQVGVDAHR